MLAVSASQLLRRSCHQVDVLLCTKQLSGVPVTTSWDSHVLPCFLAVQYRWCVQPMCVLSKFLWPLTFSIGMWREDSAVMVPTSARLLLTTTTTTMMMMMMIFRALLASSDVPTNQNLSFHGCPVRCPVTSALH
jgi:hypothetical protein